MKRLHHVDALRGLAALAVAWFHFTKAGPTDYEGAGAVADLITASGRKGWLGVEVFFVISGFILPYTMAKAGYRLRHFGTFLKKRIIRLDPPYFVAIALALSLWWAGSMVPGFGGAPFEIEPARLFLHLGYLNAFFDYPWYNVVFWTLAIEFQFYLLLALVFPVLMHRKVMVWMGTLALMCAMAFVLPDNKFVFHYLGLFALGVATAHYTLKRLNLWFYFALLGAVAWATAAATGPLVASVGVAAALVIAFVRIPHIGALTWLGMVSYSLYLVHIPIGGRVINLGTRVADTLPLQVAVLLAAVAASLFASYLLYRLVELPSQKLSSSIRYRSEKVEGETEVESKKNVATRGVELTVP